MVAPADITGRRFGKLVALRDAGSSGRRRLWDFACDCGKSVTRTIPYRSGHSTSCGCQKAGWGNKGRTPASKTHGLSRTRVKRVWANMISRCHDPRNHRYADYGGRGVAVCAAWRDLPTFASWALRHGYSDELQLDRIDNDKGYSPMNCRFVTPAENMANMRTSVRYTFFGEEMGMAEAERRFGIKRSTLRRRVEVLGYSPEEALTARPKPGAKVKHGRYSTTTNEWD